ncbi:hypothetical protein IFR35_06190 [Pseudomonas fluorescens]|uniref:hypothetical protein n=1 Tax=Pseudomonas TaxID=286 RepID=UPI00131C26A8|nr:MULTISPECIES: hypothetical protein [Pseudomonas]KAE9654979.1 hypothetical protein EJD88_11790 [Pseudomonas sp. PB105]MBD8190121.1 hypothetical protein [Pseudomonas fluorescens]MBD8224747.1 hypothetical protein [Pseudomonas fluorescens]MBD8236667.1 hypothetical protein [Pseudomonas fluorescens]MBD8783795.1 hypothetical protein [Pseudomonas fluorescens]
MTNRQGIVLALCLAALSGQPVTAAFGDNPTPAATAVANDGAAGSALPPGTYPSSPADSGKAVKQPDKTPKPDEEDKDKGRQEKPRTGS